MQDVRSALDKADGKARGPNHMEARFVKAPPPPIQSQAILRGAPPPAHWRDAHILLRPKVPGSAKLEDCRPIPLGHLDMKLLTGPLVSASQGYSRGMGWSATSNKGPSPVTTPGPPYSWRSGNSSGGNPTTSSP